MPKILIIRFSSIGDIVLTTPVVRCLKQQLKNTDVHYLTKKSFQPLLENNPYIDKCFYLEEHLSAIIPLLKKEEYDYIIDLHHNIRSFLVKFQLHAKSFSFNKLNIEKWLMVNFKINRLPDVHIVDRYMNTIETLGVVNDGKGLDYFIPAKDEIDLNSLPISHRNGYIGFVLGGKFATKCLPLHKIISICKKLNVPIVLLGGKEDEEKAKTIANAVGEKIYNACGVYNINQSASLVRQAKKIITHDTGLMHIAAALKMEITSIWGNTIPEFGMYPYYGKSQITNHKSQITNLHCRPCSKLGFAKCPKSHFKCMQEIDEDAISETSHNHISNDNL